MKTQSYHWLCICDKCGHDWKTMTSAIPESCIKCRTRKWDSEGEMAEIREELGGEVLQLDEIVVPIKPGHTEHECLQCGEIFQSKFKNPSECDGCGSTTWDQEYVPQKNTTRQVHASKIDELKSLMAGVGSGGSPKPEEWKFIKVGYDSESGDEYDVYRNEKGKEEARNRRRAV